MRMSKIAILVLTLGLGITAFTQENAEQKTPKPPQTTDKSGGLYPNDFGPAEIDVSGYPKELRQSYKIFTFKCAACHTVARPINSQFLELTPEEIAKAKKEDPELLQDDKIIKTGEPGEKIWSRYVHRMMLKPGCPVKGDDGKKIYEFLVYDSKLRKMGANARAWREHRAHLLHEFKEHYGSVYQQLFGGAKKAERKAEEKSK